VAAYKALGSIPRLQYLFLHLDASNLAVLSEDGDDDIEDLDEVAVPNDPSFDEFVQQLFRGEMFHNYRWPRNGHIRDAFINSAVDETLARAIFQVISSAKPEGSWALKKVKLLNEGGGKFGTRQHDTPNVMAIIFKLSRSWLVERNARDDSRHEVVVRELGQ
jgi:hypothetical protein